jgi:hypothetical protein
MNTYLINKKVQFIKEARADFNHLYGQDCSPFTRKIYFYFFIQNNKKYIHKRALQFIYTNADTYTNDVDPQICQLTKQITPVDVCEFLGNYTGPLLPTLLECNNSFLVYEYCPGDPVEDITQAEFNYLKTQHEHLSLTPFYNSMTYNLVRNNNQIKLVDFKHFEPKDTKPFFLYLYNRDNGVNTLYIEKGTDTEPINTHLAIDYPVKDAIIIEY